MRIVVLGTGPFAVPALRSLHDSTHEIVCAISRPPKGRRAPPAPVFVAAEELGIETWLPETVNSDEARTKLTEFAADLLMVCDYGEILKSETLAVTRLGGINLHGSLLPKYRGAAPVQWAVLNGDAETGNTVIQMTPGLDAGPSLGMQRIAIDPNETAGELEARMAEQGASLVLEVVNQLEAGTTEAVPQDKSLATKAPRLHKQQGLIDWTQPAGQIKNQVRALQPWPRAFTYWQKSEGEPLRIIVHQCDVDTDTDISADLKPGQVLTVEPQLLVMTGEHCLQLKQVQPAGKRTMTADEFLRGNTVQVGDRFA